MGVRQIWTRHENNFKVCAVVLSIGATVSLPCCARVALRAPYPVGPLAPCRTDLVDHGDVVRAANRVIDRNNIVGQNLISTVCGLHVTSYGTSFGLRCRATGAPLLGQTHRPPRHAT
jgi:hypothetical protein